MPNESQNVQSITAYCQYGLGKIDAQSVNALRAIVVANALQHTPPADSVSTLVALEEQAVTFRNILAQLAAGNDPGSIALPPEVV